MTIINPKSITGVTSITTPSGSDNLFTVHTNNTTERVRINNDGDVIVGSGITVSPDGDIFATGVTTSTTFVGALTGNVTGNATGLSGTPNISCGTVAGSTGTFTGDVDIADKIVHTGDTNTAIRFPAADTVTVETGGTEALRVDSSQRTLIGHNSSLAIGGGDNSPLQVSATSSVVFGGVRYVNSSSGPFISLSKSRATSAGSNTIVQDGDDLGTVLFAGDDGTDLISKGAQIIGQVDGTPGSNDMPGRLVFSTTADGATSPTERLRIDSSGRLLLGTTTAGHSDLDDLTIASSGHTGITIRSGTSSHGHIGFADGTSGNAQYIGLIAYDHANNHMEFITNDAERMRIDSSGRFALGSTTTNDPDVGDGGLQIRPNYSNGAPDVHFTRASSSNTSAVVGFVNGNVGVGGITYNNGGTSFNTSSDYRLKENVIAISDGITRLKTLKPSRFNFIDDETNTLRDGFIAHEVSSIVPEAITGEKDAVDSNNKPIYQGIDQAKLVPLLTAALQEAVTKIEVLETRLNNAGIAT